MDHRERITVRWTHPVCLLVYFLIASSGWLGWIPIGALGVSAQAVITIAIVPFVLVYLFPVVRTLTGYARWVLALLLVFCLWSLVEIVLHGLTSAGSQYLLIIMISVSLLILAGSYTPRGLELETFITVVRYAALLSVFSWGVQAAIGGFGLTGGRLGALALSLLVPLLIFTSRGWRTIYSWALPIVISVGIVASSARGATMVIVLAWLVAGLVRRREIVGAIGRQKPLTLVAFAAGTVLFAAAAAGAILAGGYLDRFTFGDRALSLGPLVLNSEGRGNVWGQLLTEAAQTGVFGGGIGHAQTFLANSGTGWEHPHNEFLRLYLDGGVVGLGLFLAILIVPLVYCIGALRTERSWKNPAWAGALTVVGILLFMLVDNPLAYLSATPPAAFLIGLCCTLARSRSGWLAPESELVPEKLEEHLAVE